MQIRSNMESALGRSDVGSGRGMGLRLEEAGNVKFMLGHIQHRIVPKQIKMPAFPPKTQTPRVTSKSPHIMLKKQYLGTFLFFILSVVWDRLLTLSLTYMPTAIPSSGINPLGLPTRIPSA